MTDTNTTRETTMTDRTPTIVYQAVSRIDDVLTRTNGTSRDQQTLRILKTVEEAGETARAWIGATGQNPRKGTTHTIDEVADELADVAIAALVAIAGLGLDPQQVTDRRAATVASRLPDPPAPDSPDTSSASGFTHLPPIPDIHGGRVEVVESSKASGPHVWVRAVCPANLSPTGGPRGSMVVAPMHLTADNALRLAEQIQQAVRVHQRLQGRP